MKLNVISIIKCHLGLSALSEKTRKSNRLLMLLQRQHLLLMQLFKDPECWSGRGLNLRPPAQQTGANPIEVTGRQYSVFNLVKHYPILSLFQFFFSS